MCIVYVCVCVCVCVSLRVRLCASACEHIAKTNAKQIHFFDTRTVAVEYDTLRNAPRNKHCPTGAPIMLTPNQANLKKAQ